MQQKITNKYIIIITLTVIVLAGISYWYVNGGNGDINQAPNTDGQRNSNDQTLNNNNQISENNQLTNSNVSNNPEEIDYSGEIIKEEDGWKKYVNEAVGVEFKFEDKNDEIRISASQSEVTISSGTYDNENLSIFYLQFFECDPLEHHDTFKGFVESDTKSFFQMGAESVSVTQELNSEGVEYYNSSYITFEMFIPGLSEGEQRKFNRNLYYFKYRIKDESKNNTQHCLAITPSGDDTTLQVVDSLKFIGNLEEGYQIKQIVFEDKEYHLTIKYPSFLTLNQNKETHNVNIFGDCSKIEIYPVNGPSDSYLNVENNAQAYEAMIGDTRTMAILYDSPDHTQHLNLHRVIEIDQIDWGKNNQISYIRDVGCYDELDNVKIIIE